MKATDSPLNSQTPLSQEKASHSPYFVRIFQGRMNRQNYSIGSLVILLLPTICLVILFTSFVLSPEINKLILANPYDPTQLQNSALSEKTIQNTANSIETNPNNMVVLVILLLYTLLSIPIVLSLQVRRLHDLNKSGWLMLVNLIPIVNYIFPLYVTFASGSEGENKYGPKPFARTNFLDDTLKIK